MKAEYLKYCNYYKGEDIEPDGDFLTFTCFWHTEKNYFERYEYITEKEKNWALKTCYRLFPEFREFIQNLPEIIRPMIAEYVIGVNEHSPMMGDKHIFNYKSYADKN